MEDGPEAKKMYKREVFFTVIFFKNSLLPISKYSKYLIFIVYVLNLLTYSKSFV